MARTTAAEFQRKFGEFQQQAQRREPVEITRHGRRELVLMSADHYDWLVAAARRSHRTVDAAAVVLDAVRREEMDPEHAGLDDFLKSGHRRGASGAQTRARHPTIPGAGRPPPAAIKGLSGCRDGLGGVATLCRHSPDYTPPASPIIREFVERMRAAPAVA